MDNIMIIKDQLSCPFSMEIIIMGCWHIWMKRNNLIFNNTRPRFITWKAQMNKDLKLLLNRIKDRYREDFSNWIDTYMS